MMGQESGLEFREDGIEVAEESGEFVHMQIAKSNTLIRGRYSTSLLANKVTALSMTRLSVDGVGRPTASITAAEIKEAVGWERGNSIYSQLRQVAIELRTSPIILENGTGSFYVTGMVDNCLYHNGVFKITFSMDMVPHLFDLKKNYTTLTIKSLMKFKSNSTYRIYEMIREHVYRITRENPVVCVSYSLSELRAKIGLIDFSKDDKKLLTKATIASKDDDMEKAAKKVKYKTWGEFKRNVLDIARKELMEKSEITFDYARKTQGRGGKVVGVKFYIHKNTSQEYVNAGRMDDEGGSEEPMEQLSLFEGKEGQVVDYEFIGKMQDIIEEDISVVSLIKIAEASRYNLERIKDAYEMACETKYVKNLPGFMVSAVQENWSNDPVSKVHGMSQEEAKAFTDLSKELYSEYEKQKKREDAVESPEDDFIKIHKAGKEQEGEDRQENMEKKGKLQYAFQAIDSLPDDLKEELIQHMLAGRDKS